MSKSHVNLSMADQAMYKAMKVNLPLIWLILILAYLDRVNIGFAKQALQHDIGLSNEAYAFGAGIFFLGYALFDVPSNIAMYYIGPRRWLSRIMITWGLTAIGFAFVTNDTMFYCLRFLLGVAEAGFSPTILYFITIWFSVRWRSSIIGIYYTGMPISIIIGAPVSGFLLDMDGRLGFHGWQLMFLVEGIAPVLAGLIVFKYLTDNLQDAEWLSLEEKEALTAELQIENIDKCPRYIHPLRVIIDPRVWYLTLIYIPVLATINGIAFYLPTQVSALLGQQVGTMVGFVSAIPYLCAVIAIIFVTKYSDKTGNRSMLGALLMAASGVATIISATNQPLLGIVALSIAVSGCACTVPLFWTMPSRFLIGVTAASGIAFINSLSYCATVLTPIIRVWADQHFNNPHAGLYAIGSIALLGSLLFVSASIRRMGNDAELIDSLYAKSNQVVN
jgi:MFS family permease